MSVPERFKLFEEGNECPGTSITSFDCRPQRQEDQKIKLFGYPTCHSFGFKRSSGNSCCHKYLCPVLHFCIGSLRNNFQTQERFQTPRYSKYMDISCGSEKETVIDNNGCTTTFQESLYRQTAGTDNAQNQLAIRNAVQSSQYQHSKITSGGRKNYLSLSGGNTRNNPSIKLATPTQ